jgi:hypothetical protein
MCKFINLNFFTESNPFFSSKKELYEFRHPKNPIFIPNKRKLTFRPWIHQVSTEIKATNKNASKGDSNPTSNGIKSMLVICASHSDLTLIPVNQPSTSTAVPLLAAPRSVITEHILFRPHLLDIKVQATVTGGQFNLSKVFVSSTMHEGKQQIIYKANRKIHVLDPNWVTIIHPNIKQTDALLVVLEGEHAGRFGLRICHSRSHSDTALVHIINGIEDSTPSQSGIEVRIPATHLAIVFETKEEKRLHTECVQERRKETRAP